MNQEQFRGEWNQLKGKIKQQWGRLTDDEVTRSQGRIDELAGIIQQKYGGAKEEIRRQLEEL
jgi:uncharacterized protein YjbJ (UPF0337 family)